MAIVLEVSCDRSWVSVGAEAIASTVLDRFVAVDYIELSKGRQLAFADWGYNFAALHKILFRPSYQP